MKSRLRPQVERRPLLWVSGIALAAVLVTDGERAVGAAAGILLVALVVFSEVWRVLWVGLAAAALAAWLHGNSLENRAEAASWAGKTGIESFRVIEEPTRRGQKAWSAAGRCRSTGWKVWLEGRGKLPKQGSVIGGSGVFLKPEPPRNPGEFDRTSWLARRDMAVVFRFSAIPQVISAPPGWGEWGNSIKRGFRESVTRGLDPLSEEAMVIRAVVLGEHPENDMLVEPFRLTGTLHVFAVSGLHVGMVGLIGWSLLRCCGVTHRQALLPLMLLMFGYAWLTGLKPPAVRAAWMAALVLLAFALRRRPDAGNALGLAALLVLFTQADLVYTVGVQLSFGVVLAILVLHRWMVDRFKWLTWQEPFLPRVLYGPAREASLRSRRWLAQGLGVSTAAWVGSAPLTALCFGIVTPISIVASLVLSLVIFPLLGLALFSAALGGIPGCSESLNAVNAKLAECALGIARAGSRVPGAHFAVARGRPADEFLWVFDVGDEGAACWAGGERAVMIDGASGYRFEHQVLPALRRMGIRPDSLVATHPDGGHVGGLVAAVDAFPVRRCLLPVERALGSSYRSWLEVAAGRGARRVMGCCGPRYEVGENAWLEVVGEPDGLDWHRMADERVMPVKLCWRGWRVLFVADQGWTAERKLLREGADLTADVIVAGRHAYDNSLGEAFLEATGARAVIVTHADFPSSERVPVEWRRACEERGVSVFHQGETGAVVVTATDREMTLTSWLGGRETVLTR